MYRHLNTHNAYPTPDGTLLADVRLGSPRFADCRGVGICAIFLNGMPAGRAHCRDWCQAYLSVDPPTRRLLLQFVRHTISERTFDHHFGSGYLKVQHAFRLSGEVTDRLGLPEAAGALLPGRYPVLDTDGYLLASCRLSVSAVRELTFVGRAA